MKKARVLIVGTLVVALLAGAFAVVDLVARRAGEQEFARRAQEALSLNEAPQVKLGGWPFLLHAVTRSFPSADVDISSLSLKYSGSKSLTVSNVSVTAKDIAPQGNGYVIAEAQGTGVVDYAALSVAAEHTITYAGTDKISVLVEVPVLKTTATVTGRLVLDVSRKLVSMEDAEISFVGVVVPTAISQQLLNSVTEPVSVSHDQFTVDSISVGENGVSFGVSTTQLALKG